MSAKHTPGPLQVRLASHPPQFSVENANSFTSTSGDSDMSWDDFYVRFSGYFGGYGPHMFAAAPDMLNVLRVARDCIHTDRVALADCHTGPDGMDEDGAAGCADYDAVLFAIDAAILKATGEQQ